MTTRKKENVILWLPSRILSSCHSATSPIVIPRPFQVVIPITLQVVIPGFLVVIPKPRDLERVFRILALDISLQNLYHFEAVNTPP